ncbi:MAG: hypothetical protein ACREMI_01075 [Gemmatimonadales bacterium]
MSYLTLDAGEIVATIERLGRRIEERFPGSGLGQVCGQLLATARLGSERAAAIARPIRSLRMATAALAIMLVVGIILVVTTLRPRMGDVDLGQFMQGLEASLNAPVLIGAAIFFLVTVETRIKRRRAIRALHELRAIAHIIDMHQLTKDPERATGQESMTESSPHRPLSKIELGRYLDYCSEMLSLTGKVAALYVQGFDDGVALQAVNEIEDLTTGLSQKVWQKMMILVG